MKQADNHELELIKLHLLLPIVIEVLDKDILKIKDTELKMGNVYIQYLNKIHEQVIQDTYSIKSQLKHKGIKVIEQTRTQDQLKTIFLCRGYQDKFNMAWTYIKAEVQVLMSKYMDL